MMTILFILTLGWTGAFVATAGTTDLLSQIQHAPQEHPRLIVPRGTEKDLLQKINSDPLLSQALEHVTAQATGMQGLEPRPREMEGRRLLAVSRIYLKRLLYLSLAHRLTGDPGHAEQAQKEMLSAAAFSDWNPSHFLDVGEMCAGLAIGYDWCYASLTPEARVTIREAIVEKGLRTSLPGGWWVSSDNNWNQVCHGGLVLGALAVLEDEPELAAKILDRAVENLPAAMAGYAPDGAYPEGPGYWVYGTSFNVVLLSALESVFGTDFGLSIAPGFMSSSDYYVQVTGPTGLFYNYSDSSDSQGVMPAMYWFAAKRNKPSLLWNERPNLTKFLKERHKPGDGSDRLLPLMLCWADPIGDAPAPGALHWTAQGVTPIGLHRSAWSPDATFVGIKGGSPSSNHAHMDIGSFVMDANGIRWAVDLHRQDYNSLESRGIRLWGASQDSQRWDVFRLNNLSHNTLVVNGEKQRAAGHAPLVASSGQAPMPHTIIDMSPVYEGQLASARRGIGLRPDGSVLVLDEIETAKAANVRWGMVTRAKVSLRGDRTALLTQGGQELTFIVLSPRHAEIELYETATPPRDFDAPNPGTRMIGFTAALPPNTHERLSVLLRPGKAGGRLVEIQPLSKW